MSPRQRRFDRLVGMLALVALVVGILMVLQPFVSSVLWAIVLTYSTWPLFEVVRRWVRGNSTLAAALTTALLAVVILLPITVLGLSLGDSVAPVAEAIRDWWARGLPDPPAWVADLPVVGSSLHGYWTEPRARQRQAGQRDQTPARPAAPLAPERRAADRRRPAVPGVERRARASSSIATATPRGWLTPACCTGSRERGRPGSAP